VEASPSDAVEILPSALFRAFDLNSRGILGNLFFGASSGPLPTPPIVDRNSGRKASFRKALVAKGRNGWEWRCKEIRFTGHMPEPQNLFSASTQTASSLRRNFFL
jgi:hypothetical protein